jgi:hypothetical protein
MHKGVGRAEHTHDLLDAQTARTEQGVVTLLVGLGVA